MVFILIGKAEQLCLHNADGGKHSIPRRPVSILNLHDGFGYQKAKGIFWPQDSLGDEELKRTPSLWEEKDEFLSF